LPGGGGPGQVNGFTLFLLLFRLRLKYFYVTYHGIFQEVGHKIPVQVQYKMKRNCGIHSVDLLFLILKESEDKYLFCKIFVVTARFTVLYFLYDVHTFGVKFPVKCASLFSVIPFFMQGNLISVRRSHECQVTVVPNAESSAA
jgi:hypothetical protein